MDEHDWIIDLETGARASPRCSANSRKAKFGYLEMLSEIDPKKIPKISNLGLSFLEIPDQLSNLCLSIKKTSKKKESNTKIRSIYHYYCTNQTKKFLIWLSWSSEWIRP